MNVLPRDCIGVVFSHLPDDIFATIRLVCREFLAAMDEHITALARTRYTMQGDDIYVNIETENPHATKLRIEDYNTRGYNHIRVGEMWAISFIHGDKKIMQKKLQELRVIKPLVAAIVRDADQKLDARWKLMQECEDVSVDLAEIIMSYLPIASLRSARLVSQSFRAATTRHAVTLAWQINSCHAMIRHCIEIGKWYIWYKNTNTTRRVEIADEWYCRHTDFYTIDQFMAENDREIMTIALFHLLTVREQDVYH